MIIKTMGINNCHDKNFSIFHQDGTGEYVLLIIKSKAFFRINGEEIYANPNSVIIYDKSTTQDFRADGEAYINDWICLDLSEEERCRVLDLKIIFDTVFEVSDTVFLSQIMNMIHHEKYASSIHSEQSISLYLELLFLKLSEAIQTNIDKKHNYHNELIRLRNKIYSSPTEKFTIKKLAAEVNLSPSYFQHLYKTQFNTSPVKDAIASRMEYAKYLLSSTSYPINEIAASLGYLSDIQFISQFKTFFRQTPGQYRKKYKK